MRAKMFYLDKSSNSWKERGAGMLKINVPRSSVAYDKNGAPIPGTFDASSLDADEEASGDEGNEESAAGKTTARKEPKVVRLIMRQDSTLRVILNTVVLANMDFIERPSLKATTILFAAFEGDGTAPISVQMKVRKLPQPQASVHSANIAHTIQMNAANAKAFLNEIASVQRELRGS